MCFPVHYTDDGQMSGTVNQEHKLVVAEDSAVVHQPGRLKQIPALAGLRHRNWRCLRKQLDTPSGW
jgi:hypothetical protein